MGLGDKHANRGKIAKFVTQRERDQIKQRTEDTSSGAESTEWRRSGKQNQYCEDSLHSTVRQYTTEACRVHTE
jgi:hypothetical protein